MKKDQTKQIMSRVIGGFDKVTIKEGTERELVEWCRKRFPFQNEIPINEWFIPNPSTPVEVMITDAFKEG